MAAHTIYLGIGSNMLDLERISWGPSGTFPGVLAANFISANSTTPGNAGTLSIVGQAPFSVGPTGAVSGTFIQTNASWATGSLTFDANDPIAGVTVENNNNTLLVDWPSFLGGDDLFPEGSVFGDVIDGGGGSNTVQYSDTASSTKHTIQRVGNAVLVTEDGKTDTLLNIQFIRYNDRTIDTRTIVPASPAPNNPIADILLQNTNGALGLWQMNGATFVGGGEIEPNPGPTWFAVGKGAFYSGDRSDVVWQNQNGAVVIWQVQGTHAIGGALVGNPGPSWHVEGTRDFNSDGHADIVFQNDDGTLVLWEMNGAIFIGGGSIANPGPTWHVKGTGDFYGDGHSDVLWQNDDGSVAIWKMDGTQIIAGGGVGNPGSGWHIKGIGDFNADSHTDVLWQDDNGAVAIWELNGTSFIGGGVVGDPGPTWHVKATGDYNNDGHTDIAFQNDDGSVAIWELNGASFIGGGGVGNPGATWIVVDDNMRFTYSASAGETLAASSVVPDEFVFTSFAAGQHVISGFNPGQDVIEFSKAQFASFADVQAATAKTAGGSTKINLGTGSSLLLPGLNPASLHASDFAFS